VSDYPNWFKETAQHNFEQFLLPLAGQDKLKFLQLGAYTGDASVWLAENVLTGSDSYLLDIDTWQGSDEEAHKSMDFEDVFNTYIKKINNFTCIKYFRSTTQEFLLTMWKDSPSYDFIYIDADHTTVGVLMDAELSWPLLKPGGILAFDDYEWGENLPLSQRPKPGIQLFLERHAGEFENLVVNNQYWIKKK